MKHFTLSCYSCEHRYKNDSFDQQYINGKHMKAFDEYCGFHGKVKKMKRIGRRDKPKGRLHPAWCPLYHDAGSCIECGKIMYGDEGITCKTCKRKGL